MRFFNVIKYDTKIPKELCQMINKRYQSIRINIR